MPSFREVLTATDADLVKFFYRFQAGEQQDFIQKINHAAAQLGLNHAQLVCALGFNKNIRDLTDILSVVGFSSYKLLSYRRNELFTHDVYHELDIDNIVDIYSEYLEDPDILATLRELLLPRLDHLESRIAEDENPAHRISYKMEVHSIYAGGIVTPEIALARIERPIGDLRMMVEEIQLVVEEDMVPAGNLFFSDYLLPDEKRHLIEAGKVDHGMIRNRLQNEEISEDERQMLEDFV